MICFGVFPAWLCYMLGVRYWPGYVLMFFYCICAVIRLAFFNVLEANRQKTQDDAVKTYRGLPVTSIAFILPLVFWLQFLIPDVAFLALLHLVLLVVGFLFILDFKLPKPGLKTILLMSAVLAVTVGVIFAFTNMKVPPHDDTSNGLLDAIGVTDAASVS